MNKTVDAQWDWLSPEGKVEALRADSIALEKRIGALESRNSYESTQRSRDMGWYRDPSSLDQRLKKIEERMKPTTASDPQQGKGGFITTTNPVAEGNRENSNQ